MSTETCTVLLKMPNGLIVEGGYTIDPRTCAMVKSPAYYKIELNGWNKNTIAAARAIGQKDPLSPAEPAPGVTLNVNVEQIEEWMKRHPRMAKMLTIVRDPKSAKDASKDMAQTPSHFDPIRTDGKDPRVKSLPIKKADFTSEE